MWLVSTAKHEVCVAPLFRTCVLHQLRLKSMKKMVGPCRKGCFSPLLCNKGPSYCPRKGLKIFVIQINLIKSFCRSWDQIWRVSKNLRQMDILLPQSNSYFGVLWFVERKSDGLAPGTFLRAVRQTRSQRFFGLSCAVINRRSGMGAARP